MPWGKGDAPDLGVDWGIALWYAVAGLLALRHPVLLSVSGATGSAVGGLMLALLWRHGLPAALVALAASLAGARAWRAAGRQGFREMAGGAIAALGASGLAAAALRLAGAPAWAAWPATVLAYWLAGCAAEAAWTARELGRPLRAGWLALLAGTWWSAPLHAGIGLLLVWAGRHAWAEGAVALALACGQASCARILNPVLLDRAVADLLRRAGHSPAGGDADAGRRLRYGRAIGRTLRLPEEQLRLIGYAGLLQVIGGGPAPPPAAETGATPPDPALRALLRAHAGTAADLVRRVPPLAEVSRYIRFRYAWWDGSGEPAGAAGNHIPLGAQVLAAANALTRIGGGLEEALLWLRSQSGRRLAPEVARAAEAALRQEAAAGEEPPCPPADVAALAELARALNASTSLDGALEVVLAAAAGLCGGAAFAALCGEGGGDLVVHCAHGFQRVNPAGCRLPAGDLPPALAHQEVAAIDHPGAEGRGALWQRLASEEGIRSSLILPLVARGRTLGILFAGVRGFRRFSRREAALLSLVAAQAALAVDNSRLLAQAEERLERVTAIKRTLDLVIDHLPAGILLVDVAGQVLVVNRLAREMLIRAGWPPVEAGQAVPRNQGWIAGALHRVLAGEEAVTEICQLAPDLAVEVRSAAMKDEQGRLVGVLVIGWDVTQVRRMEQQVQRVERLAAMGKLAAGAAHEIRNPLTAVRGFMQLLQARQAPDSPEAEYTQIILSEIGRIEAIVRDLLLLARPSEPVRAPFSLPALLDEVLLLLEEDLRGRGVAVIREYDRRGAWALGDQKLLKQVAHNLLRNAAEAMDGAGGRLTVAAGAAGAAAWFRVADSGPGIPPEHLPRLFTPFFTTKETGTGLGLAICYAIVEAHGGRIEVQSQPGAGAAFTVWLPAAEVTP